MKILHIISTQYQGDRQLNEDNFQHRNMALEIKESKIVLTIVHSSDQHFTPVSQSDRD